MHTSHASRSQDPSAFKALHRGKPRIPRLSLALQGGGALGAFTWGVLDALLRKGVSFEAISGASAGAVNAVVMANALMNGDGDHASERLAAFWQKTSEASHGTSGAFAAFNLFNPIPMSPSPAISNPLRANPLRDLIAAEVDFERLSRESPIRLFVAATRVKDGRARVFQTHEITLDAVLASACLPQFQAAVEIDGEAYWDGGYSANPPIMELVRATEARDLLVVELTTPGGSSPDAGGRGIEKRLHDFALGASLQRELDTLLDLQEMVGRERAARSPLARRLRKLRVHRLSAQLHLPPANSALDLGWAELKSSSAAGHAAGERWFDATI